MAQVKLGKATKGFVHRLMCPWCGRAFGLTEEWKQRKVEKMAVFGCPSCKRMFAVTEIVEIPYMTIAQYIGDLRADRDMQTFEDRARHCVNATCQAAPSSRVRCGICNQIDDDYGVDHCPSHRSEAVSALNVHMRMEHRCLVPSCDSHHVQYKACRACVPSKTEGVFRVAHCPNHVAEANSAIMDHRRAVATSGSKDPAAMAAAARHR